jgi:hypothetical protein
MTRRWPLILLACAWSLPPRACLAGAGEEGFSHLTEGPGARSAAMGGTGVSLGGDADAAFWNPAALATARARELAVSHAARALSVSDESLAYVHPLRTGGVGARVFIRRVGDAPGYDASGGKISDYGATDTVMTAGYGRSVGRRLKLGAAVKQARQSIAGYSGGAVAADAGLLYPMASWPLTLALGARNMGGKASFLQEKTALPRLLDAGASARLFSGALVLAVEGHNGSGETFWNGGLEFWAHNLLAFRAGLDTRRDAGGGAGFGFGVRLKRVRVDYALLPQGEAFGSSHRLSLAFRFGGGGDAAYQEGLAFSQRGDYARAILRFKDALDADPGHPGASRGLKEAIALLELERSRR